jgi:hypothetical protein
MRDPRDGPDRRGDGVGLLGSHARSGRDESIVREGVAEMSAHAGLASDVYDEVREMDGARTLDAPKSARYSP